jgi:ribosomal protein L11 methyltransferase
MTKATDIPLEYLEVTLEVPRAHADAVCNFLIDNVCSGLVLEEEEDSPVTGVKFYVPADDDRNYRTLLSNYLLQLVDKSMPEVPRIQERSIKNVEWNQQYRKSVEPVRVSEDLVVRPPWVQASTDVRYDIVIEPKMAFGTGRHETTRTCLRIVREKFKAGGRFLDLGCGSGILCILADKMKAGYIKAVDHDLVAIESAHENFAINNVTCPHDIAFGSLDKCQGDQPYDFIATNIIKSTIMVMIQKLAYLLAGGGILLLSGLLEPDLPDISSELNRNGLNRFTTVRDNEWFTFIVYKG